MQYKGMDLIKSIEPQIFDPPKRMLVWNENDREPRIDTIYAVGPSSMDLPVRAISDDGRLGTHCYKYCAEIPKSRRATKQELARWIAKGKGEWKDRTGDYAYVQWDSYREAEANEPCNERIVVRKLSDAEWHEPNIDYMEIEET